MNFRLWENVQTMMQSVQQNPMDRLGWEALLDAMEEGGQQVDRQVVLQLQARIADYFSPADANNNVHIIKQNKIDYIQNLLVTANRQPIKLLRPLFTALLKDVVYEAADMAVREAREVGRHPAMTENYMISEYVELVLQYQNTFPDFDRNVPHEIFIRGRWLNNVGVNLSLSVDNIVTFTNLLRLKSLFRQLEAVGI